MSLSILEFESRFTKIRFLGSGGEGAVYEAREFSNPKSFALKIANNNWKISPDNRKVVELIRSILKNGKNPHLVDVYDLFEVECRVFTVLTGHQGNSFFNRELPAGDAVSQRRCYVMELLEGDLEQLETVQKVSKEIRIAFRVQLASIHVLMQNEGIITIDAHKMRNIVYKKLGPEDMYQGQEMTEFDIWKYTFGELEFYLPKPSYLIKLADYDSWMISREKKVYDPIETLEIFTGNLIKLSELQQLFQKPTDFSSRVLEILG